MLLYITGGVGIFLSVIAIILVLIFHAKNKSKIVPMIIYVFGLALFVGSGFLYSTGFELNLPKKDSTDNVQQTNADDPDSVGNTTKNSEENNKNSTIEPDPAPVPDVVPAPISDSSGTLGNYYVEIKDASIVKDYDGNPAVVITYAWTNNSEDTTSAEVALMEKAFQDGVQLSAAFIGDSSVYNSELSFKSIRPGTTFDVQCAFALTSESSIIEFELSEFLGLSNDVVTKDFDPTTFS